MNPATKAADKKALEKAATTEVQQSGGTVSGLADGWLEMVHSGEQISLAAARQFIEMVDVVLPIQGGDDSRRRKLIDGAFGLADQAAAAQLAITRSALRRASVFHVDVDVHVDTDVKAFNDIDVGVTVPTDVGAFTSKGQSLK